MIRQRPKLFAHIFYIYYISYISHISHIKQLMAKKTWLQKFTGYKKGSP